MRYKIIIYFLLSWLALIIQISFLNNFYFLSIINLPLMAIVLMICLSDFTWTAILAIWSGIFLDLYSGLPFGVYLFCFFLTAIILEFLFLNWLTNRSLFALMILGLVSVLSYNLIFVIVTGTFHLFGWNDFVLGWGYLGFVVLQLVYTSVLLYVCFRVINKLSKSFKPIFLRS